MKLNKLFVVAASAALCLTACSDESSTVMPDGDALAPADTLSGNEFSGNEVPSGEASGTEASGNENLNNNPSGSEIPGTNVPASDVPGGEIPGGNPSGNDTPVNNTSGGDVSGNNAPGGDVPGTENPNSNTPVNSVTNTSGDDENDLEDARTLTGAEILLKLSGTSATVDNNNGCVEVGDKVATITCPGAYYVTGESSDFQVVVNTPAAENEGNTGIYLFNATLKSQNSPILVKNAEKTVIHLVKGTTNVVEDGNGNHLYTKLSGAQDTAKAAIYAKDDLNIKGAGKLTVNGNFRNGIHCSNDLKIKNGDITVVAKDNAIKGKGSLQISGGTLNITAKEGDGLESDECEENPDGSCKNIVENKGVVEITGGNITIKSGDDGIQASNYVLVNDSSETSTIKINSTGKGLMAEKTIYIDGGSITVDAEDDAMHTHYSIYMNAGNVTVSSKDDGLHADSAMYLKGSTINVVTAYEGIEAYKIFAEGGVTSTYATNDGWNAAGGAKEDLGGYSMFSESSGHIVISGGYHYIASKGDMIDVLDANGTAKMSGGVLILEITGQSYENSMGGMGGMGGFGGMGGMGGMGGWGGGMGGGGGGNGCPSNMAGGLIDTDAGFEITGGVLLAFGDYSTDTPNCASVSFTSDKFYGSDNAAFKPEYHGSTIFYGGDVKSVAEVNVSGMKELKFPNGKSYMYK